MKNFLSNRVVKPLKPSFMLAGRVLKLFLLVIAGLPWKYAYPQVANFGNLYIPAAANVAVPVAFTNNAAANYVNDGTITLSGDVTNNQAAVSPANGTTVLGGASLQTIGGTQPFYAHHFTLNKTNYTQLDASLFVNGVFTLTNGILTTGNNKLLTLQTNASIAGLPSVNAFVNGPMVWQTNAAQQYDFPVGKTTPYIQYQPVSVVRTSALGNASFTAEFVAANPMVSPYGDVIVDPILGGIFSNRYWTVQKDFAPANAADQGAEARVMINYAGNPGAAGWTPLAPNASSNVAIASWSPAGTPTLDVPGYWGFTKSSHDFTSSGGSYLEAIYNTATGPVYSAPLTSFNAFTVGFGNAIILPAILLSFNATLVNSNDGWLQWTVSDDGSLAGFELLHGTDGDHFTTLASVAPNGGSSYSYRHLSMAGGKHYYKLRLKDKDGTASYSAVKMLQVDKAATYIKGLRATVVGSEVRPIVFSASNQKAGATIFDAAGRLIQQQECSLQKGLNEWPMNIGHLAAGTYFVQIITADGVKGSLQFLKRQ